LRSRRCAAETDVRRQAKNVAGLSAEVKSRWSLAACTGSGTEADVGGWGTMDRSEQLPSGSIYPVMRDD
jgi:hypothetical protein